MSWEELDPNAKSNPDGLTAPEISKKWGLGESQTRARLRKLEEEGIVKRVVVSRRDSAGRNCRFLGWVIIDGPEGST